MTQRSQSRYITVLTLLIGSLSLPCLAYDDAVSESDESQRRYTFSWLFIDDDEMKPRGGTTKGPEITLANTASSAWNDLQQPGLSDKERDRRAILAMAGGYRTTFDFIETVGFSEGYTPSRPYQSWGTEYVYVVADEPDFISLQHILVMQIQQENGELSDPIVIKHWRHDWTFEDRDLMEYAGYQHFAPRRLGRREARGTWSQAVFQVDDSPRYETYGRWYHEPGYSHWESAQTMRPLPRREFSVRDDYHALLGQMRISVTPTGWVMEEDALKTVMDSPEEVRATSPYLAREAGISRYERIVDYDFSAGDVYWESTQPFWAAVREYWSDVFSQGHKFHVAKKTDDQSLFGLMFSMAEEEHEDVDKAISDAIAPFIDLQE